MFSFFLKFDGEDALQGEEQDGWIEVLSFSWGLTNEGPRGNGGSGGAGRVNVQDLNFTKHTDKASPNLMLACATGQHIKKATLEAREAADENALTAEVAGAANLPAVQMELLLTDIMVTNFVIKGEQKADNPIPSESLSLNFSKIEFSERYQKADGQLSDPVRVGWDIKANKKA